MSSEATKYALAKAMEECMRTQSVENITVTEIVRRCGVARQTFYRNFLDKYDLINWYFAERVFFAAAFRADGTNSLKEHDTEAIIAFYTGLILRKTGSPPEGETAFLLELYCRGSVSMTVKWVLGGMRTEPAELARCMVDALPAPLEALFKRLELL